MEDGTIRAAHVSPLDSVKFPIYQSQSQEGMSYITGDTAYKYAQTITNADAMILGSNSDVQSVLGNFLALDFTDRDGASFIGEGLSGTYSSEMTHIAQIHGSTILYIDGTVNCPDRIKSNLKEDISQTWTDIVQVGYGISEILGLKSDGTLVSTLKKTDFYSQVPEEYRTGVYRLFDHYMQLSDGTIFSFTNYFKVVVS